MAGVFTLACRHKSCLVSHYGRFWQNLSINYGIILTLVAAFSLFFLKIIGFKVSKTGDCLPSFEFVEIEAKIQLQWLNFKLEFLDKNSPNRP